MEIIAASDFKSGLNYKHLTNEVMLACNRMVALYQCCQAKLLSWSFQPGRLADSLPAESASSPKRAFHRAASALLAPHTHPSCLVGLSNPGSPLAPTSPNPSTTALSLFLRFIGLVKVSWSPVALLYRLQCFLLKRRLLSCEYTHLKNGWVVPHLPLPSPFVIFVCFSTVTSGCPY